MYIKYYTNEQTVFGNDDTTGIDIEASLHYLLDKIEAALRVAYPDASIETGIDLGGLDTDGDDERDNIQTIAERVWTSFDWIVRIPRRAKARFYVTVKSARAFDLGTHYGPFYTKGEARKFAAAAEVFNAPDEADNSMAIVYTHTQMVKRFGRSFENAPENYVVGTKLDAHLR